MDFRVQFDKLIGHKPAEATPSASEQPAESSRGLGNLLRGKIRSLEERATAHHIRSRFVKLAKESISNAVKNPEAAPLATTQAAEIDGSLAKKNEAIAKEALQKVRLALYTIEFGSYKSFNKRRKNESEEDALRRTARGKFPQLSDFKGITNPRHISALRSKNIWKSTLLNCDALSYAVLDYVSHKYPDVPVFLVSVPGHHVAAIGTIGPEHVNQPMELWPEHVYICDSWANLYCPAREYAEKFSEKMKTWEKNNKPIFDQASQWANPADSDLISHVKGVSQIQMRQRYEDNQFGEILLNTREQPFQGVQNSVASESGASKK